MRLRHLVLLAVPFTACAYTERYPFRTVANSEPSATLPPGVRVALVLDGVHDVPTERIPVRSYELRLEIEQNPDAPQWTPSFDGADLRDDEGNVFRLSSWFVDARKTAPGTSRYRCVFELQQPYRFQSILAVTVRWKLVSRGSPVFRIASHFQQ